MCTSRMTVHVCTYVYKNLDTHECVQGGEKAQTQRWTARAALLSAFREDGEGR